MRPRPRPCRNRPSRPATRAETSLAACALPALERGRSFALGALIRDSPLRIRESRHGRADARAARAGFSASAARSRRDPRRFLAPEVRGQLQGPCRVPDVPPEGPELGAICGFVYLDIDIDGVRDIPGGDRPLVGVRVMLTGTTADGRPYFVMEFVDGEPITEYCDRRRLPTRARLALFTDVCAAVQHAHQKGVIHRDLKPSNILVSEQDGRAFPKVIDFGVARAVDRPSARTFSTEEGMLIGTPDYMSPEQAALSDDVDTTTDVYSLGVLMYELLVGSPPFSRRELGKAGVLEILRVIREQEPTKPSVKLSTAEGLPALAVNRGTEPKRLMALVRGELDWIVMKALEKLSAAVTRLVFQWRSRKVPEMHPY